jgi:glutathione peroxidase
MSIYQFSLRDNRGNEVPLEQFKGKVLLVVNTATRCGLTPQYEALENLYQQFKDRGFEVLDFPCNQFMKQAPGTDEEIQSFCVTKYNTSFPRFAKIEVNGPGAHPLYGWLKEQAPQDKGDAKAAKFEKTVKLFSKFKGAGDIKWNFGKFLIDREGRVAARYSPAYTPDQLAADIEALL